jgi:hypothetical protein
VINILNKDELELIKREILGYSHEYKREDVFYIISYDLKDLDRNKKVLFSFALFGRKNGEGLINELGGEKLGSGCIFVPEKSCDKIEEFLKFWSVNYRKIKVKVLER